MKTRYVKFLVLFILICAAFYLLPPKIAIIFNNKGVIADSEDDFPAAIDFYKKAIQLDPNAKTYFNLASLYERTGNDDQAILEFKKAIEHDHEYKSAYNALAEIYAAKGDYRQAEDFLNKLKAFGEVDTSGEFQNIKQDRIVQIYNQGVRFYDLGLEEKALNKFQEVIALDASNSLAYKAAADIYYNQGKLQESIRYYKKGIALGRADADAFNSLGIIYMRLEDYHKAIKYFRKACEMDRENLHYLYNLASTLRDSSQFNEALSLYNKVVAGSSFYPNVHNDIAGIYSQMGFSDKAEMEYGKERDISADLIKAGKTDDFVLTRLAVSYNGLNKSDESEEILDEIIARNPDYYKAYYARAQMYQKQGKHALSLADYRKARQLVKKTASQAYGQTQQAEQSGEKVLKKILPKAEADKYESENAVIYMHNGHVVRGRIKRETDKKVVLVIKTGRSESIITFHKSKIKEIKRIK